MPNLRLIMLKCVISWKGLLCQRSCFVSINHQVGWSLSQYCFKCHVTFSGNMLMSAVSRMWLSMRHSHVGICQNLKSQHYSIKSEHYLRTLMCSKCCSFDRTELQSIHQTNKHSGNATWKPNLLWQCQTNCSAIDSCFELLVPWKSGLSSFEAISVQRDIEMRFSKQWQSHWL